MIPGVHRDSRCYSLCAFLRVPSEAEVLREMARKGWHLDNYIVRRGCHPSYNGFVYTTMLIEVK